MRELTMILFAMCLLVLFKSLKIPQTKASWVNTDEVDLDLVLNRCELAEINSDNCKISKGSVTVTKEFSYSG